MGIKTKVCIAEIERFYQNFSIQDGRQLCEELLRNRGWKEGQRGVSPSDLLFFIGEIEKLIENVYQIMQGKEKARYLYRLAKVQKAMKVEDKESYCRPGSEEMAWQEFPRTIGTKGYRSPCDILEKFVEERKKKEWKMLLKELQYYSLANEKMANSIDKESLLDIRENLLEMVEACYLIVIRYWRKK